MPVECSAFVVLWMETMVSYYDIEPCRVGVGEQEATRCTSELEWVGEGQSTIQLLFRVTVEISSGYSAVHDEVSGSFLKKA